MCENDVSAYPDLTDSSYALCVQTTTEIGCMVNESDVHSVFIVLIPHCLFHPQQTERWGDCMMHG
ncbi:hypothetical protein RIEGSTA812A_PEG_361 [invertebrate metagenome]|uniref:Uncharacterized protein n=1 Tax=invertebrate metagenome TaxID=1711999 RepID=A0A484H9P5_9ZZZZ